MCVWCGKSGYDSGIGKSVYSIRVRDVLMCSERYDDDIPLVLPKTQLPPTRSDFSMQSEGIPRSCSAFAAVMPEEPAPMTQTDGSWVIAAVSSSKLTQASFKVPPLRPPLAGARDRAAPPP